MALSAWVAYTFIAALVMAGSVAHYQWRERAGTRSVVLGIMRGTGLALITLLLFDPAVPTAADRGRTSVALVDASLSMSLSGEEGERRWDQARRIIAAAEPDRIQLFGSGSGRTVAGLDSEPGAARSQLAPALRSVLEAGAGRVLVVTDGAIEDGAEVQRLAAEAGVPIDVRVVGGETRGNLGLETIEGPGWVEAGEEAIVRAAVARLGELGPALPDSATVTLHRGDREVARARIAVPAAGRTSTVELRFRPDAAVDGLVRLDVRVSPGGAVADDDVRSVYVRIADSAAGVVLVSFRPDQEPRFLLPVLEQALDLPVRGWIGLRGARFLRLGGGSEAGVVTPVGSVRQAVAEAGLLVLHGVDSAAPEWVLEAMRESERVLVLPSDPPPRLPVPIQHVREGEWYLSAELPSSPVAPLLAGIDPTGLAPLNGLRPIELPQGYWTPLRARLGRRGEAYPVIVAGRGAADRQRIAITLGTGYWRWAFAGPEGRAVYERLWTAVAGWLMEDVEGLDREPVRPASSVVARGAAVRWVVGVPADSVALEIQRVLEPTVGESPTEPGTGTAARGAPDAATGSTVPDTIVGVEDGIAVTGVLPPGQYRYAARTAGGAAAEGPFTVESYTPELLHGSVALDGVTGGEAVGVVTGGGRPLHTSPWPYIVVVALLCAEWVLRRRWGLR